MGALTKYMIDKGADSIRLGDDTNLVTVTNVGADYGLDVNLINASIAVTATDLDIRALDSSTDSVEIKTAGGQALAIDGSGYITANINGDVNVTQGTDPWIVSATDLDIRDLTNASDSVAVGSASAIVDVLALDAAAAGTENGFMIGGIRQDAGGSPVSADGDFHPFIFNDDGELKCTSDLSSAVADDAADSGNPIKIGGNAETQASVWTTVDDADRFHLSGDLYRRVKINDAPNVGLKSATVSVDTTVGGVNLSAAPQAGRTRMIIQNTSNSQDIFIGASGVTAATGTIVPKKGQVTLEIGEALDVYAITSAGSADVRVFEIG